MWIFSLQNLEASPFDIPRVYDTLLGFPSFLGTHLSEIPRPHIHINILCPLSKFLHLISVLKPVLKKEGNLDFNIGETKVLGKGTTTQHVFDRDQHFFDFDPYLQEIALKILLLTCSRLRVSKYLDHRWSTTSTSRILWLKTVSR